jgi:VWFA-related protein
MRVLSFGRASIVACGIAAGLFASAVFAAQQPFVERVEVARVLIDARVLDEDGQSVPSLGPDDFEVRIDGKPARVDSAEWIGSSGTTAPPSLASDDIQRATARQASSLPSTSLGAVIGSSPPGRSFVFFVQKPLSAGRSRDMGGLMRALQVVEPLLAQLTPDDRVAVLSFDSHVRIWSDFTNDVNRVRELLRKEVLLGSPGPVSPSRDRSLLSVLTRERGQRTYTVEEALRLIGNALEPLLGAKTVVILGFGFGQLNPASRRLTLYEAAMLPGVLERNYDEARAALLAARATVFSVDITDADRHTLEAGLQAVAADTGGFFVRTNLFPDLSMKRVANALAGHYVLFVEKPDVPPGIHRLSVRLVRRDGKVLAPGTVTLSPP